MKFINRYIFLYIVNQHFIDYLFIKNNFTTTLKIKHFL